MSYKCAETVGRIKQFQLSINNCLHLTADMTMASMQIIWDAKEMKCEIVAAHTEQTLD